MPDKSKDRSAARKVAPSMDALSDLTKKILKVSKKDVDDLVAVNKKPRLKKHKPSSE